MKKIGVGKPEREEQRRKPREREEEKAERESEFRERERSREEIIFIQTQLCQLFTSPLPINRLKSYHKIYKIQIMIFKQNLLKSNHKAIKSNY